MHAMTAEERQQFLSTGKRTAKVATVMEDGSPHVVPVWYALDGEQIVFTTWHTTVKRANLERDARVAICIDDEKPPYAFVMIQGIARLEFHAPDLADWTTRIAGRYLGEAVAEDYGERNAVEGEVLVRVTPTKFIAQSGIAD